MDRQRTAYIFKVFDYQHTYKVYITRTGCRGENPVRCGGVVGVVVTLPIYQSFRRSPRRILLQRRNASSEIHKGRLGILKYKYHICDELPFLTLHSSKRNRYVRKSSVITKTKAFLPNCHSQ